MLTIRRARLVDGKARGRRYTLRYSKDEQRSQGRAGPTQREREFGSVTLGRFSGMLRA
jgi:hypothetical protein